MAEDDDPQDGTSEEGGQAGPEARPPGVERGVPDLGTPPSVAAMAMPQATLYPDPSVVEPLPTGERWEVAKPVVGSIADLPELPATPTPAAASGAEVPPLPTPSPGAVGPVGTASFGAPLLGRAAAGPVGHPDGGGGAAERRSAPLLVAGAAVLVVVLLVGLAVVLVGGGDEPDTERDVAAAVAADAVDAVEGASSTPEVTAPTVDSVAPDAPPTSPEPTTTVTTAAVPPPVPTPSTTVAPPPVTEEPLPPAVVVPVAPGERLPAQLVVSAVPMDGPRLVVGHPDRATTIRIDNVGGTIGSFTISGSGLITSFPSGSIGAGGSTTVTVSATAGPDRLTELLVQGSGGLSIRYEVVVV